MGRKDFAVPEVSGAATGTKLSNLRFFYLITQHVACTTQMLPVVAARAKMLNGRTDVVSMWSCRDAGIRDINEVEVARGRSRVIAEEKFGDAAHRAA